MLSSLYVVLSSRRGLQVDGVDALLGVSLTSLSYFC